MRLINITYFAAPENLLRGCGPCSKTFSAVSEKPSTGVFVDLHTLCDVFTCENKENK